MIQAFGGHNSAAVVVRMVTRRCTKRIKSTRSEFHSGDLPLQNQNTQNTSERIRSWFRAQNASAGLVYLIPDKLILRRTMQSRKPPHMDGVRVAGGEAVCVLPLLHAPSTCLILQYSSILVKNAEDAGSLAAGCGGSTPSIASTLCSVVCAG